jgi:hypothetical protein
MLARKRTRTAGMRPALPSRATIPAVLQLVTLSALLSLLLFVSPATAAADVVQLSDAAGKVLVRVESQPPTFQLRDGAGGALGEVKVDGDRVKLRDPGGAERWKIKRKDYGAEIENAAGDRLYRIVKRPDGWRVEDAKKAVVARIKPRESGATVIRDDKDVTLARVKPGDGGLVVEGDGGKRVGKIAGTTDARAGGWLALERFSPAERAALWAYFTSIDK